MNHNIRIAKQLVRIAKMLVAFNRNELEKQLKKKRSDLNESSMKEHLDCLEKMDAKEQKVALHWIGKKNLTLPDDLSTFNNAMNLIKKQHLDFQKFDDPMEVLNRDDKSTLKIRSQDERFNPDTEKTFSHPYNAGDGVVIYNVEDSKEGQKAVRRATDFYFGYDKNFWCLASRKDGFRRNEINRLTREQAEKLGFYSDDALAVAWNYWKANSAYPKRIAFKNGKLFAFSAGKKKQHVEWWDRNDKSHYDIPESNAVDDIEFLKKYGKINLVENDNTSPEMIEELAEDEDADVRYAAAENPNIPTEVLMRLAEDEDRYMRSAVSRNPRIPAEVLKKLAVDEDGEVRYEAARNSSNPVEALRKLAENKDEYVRRGVAYNSNTPAEVFMKLAEDEDRYVRFAVASNPNTPIEALRKLAENKDEYVRKGVAYNSNTPAEILMRLAEDEEIEVRYSVVSNPRTPAEILSKLAEDEDWHVRFAVARHPSTPVEILSKLAEDKNERVRCGVAKNPRTPTEVLMRLAEDENASARYEVANNPRTPAEALRKLAEDEDKDVRRSAKSQLRRRGQ